MPKTVHLPHVRTYFNGAFDLNALVSAIRNWFFRQNYDVAETDYKHMQADFGHTVKIQINTEKNITSYVRNTASIFVFVKDMREVEVVKEGVKVKMQHGRVTVEIDPAIDFDWQGRWEVHGLWEKLRDFYHKYIFKQELETKWWDAYYYQLYDFQKQVKNVLGMEG